MTESIFGDGVIRSAYMGDAEFMTHIAASHHISTYPFGV